VAVGPAHNFEIRKLAATPELVFELGRSRTRVATATRLLVELGLPLSVEGGSVATDLAVFALDAPPAGARALAPAAVQEGMRVRVLGIPGSVARDEEALDARVREATPAQLVVDLDEFHDVRGWGGAPIVPRDGDGVVGFVQAAQVEGRTLRLLATPIGVALEALRFPLEDGRGRSFAALLPPAETAAPEEPAPLAPARPAPLRPLSLEIELPAEGDVVGGEPATFVAGRARRGDAQRTDVVFAIDVSGSTGAPSGADVNGNGVVGAPPTLQGEGFLSLGSTDPGDSVLAAEIAAMRRLLARLDPRRTRVGVVTFAGQALESGALVDDPALTEIALGSDYASVQSALDRVLARGANGATHMAAGVDRATVEVLGTRRAYSKGDPASEKVLVLLSDGKPTLPEPGDDAANVEAVLQAGLRARRAKIRAFTYAVGSEALESPLALLELAGFTGGRFTPVRDPARLSELVVQVDFSDVGTLAVRNATLDVPAHASELGADGSFGAYVPLVVGRNEIEVSAVGPDGARIVRRLEVQYRPDAPPAAVPDALAAARARVLEEALASARRARVASEQSGVDAVRERLADEMERERARARDRAEAERKRLDLEIEAEP
jgi:Mg-chelatase subunit ChlD